MEFKLETPEPNYGILTLQVSEKDYMPEVDKEIKKYSKTIQLKGFRPGKVPPGVVRKMFGKGIKTDVFNRTVNDALNGYVEEQKLETIYPPLLKEEEQLDETQLSSLDDVTLTFEVALQPEINYKADESVTVKRYKVVFGEEEVDKQVETVREQNSKAEELEVSEKGAFLHGKFVAEDGTMEQETVLPLNQVAEDALEVFLNKKVGDEIQFDLRTALPDDKEVKILFGLYQDEEKVSTLSGMFTLTLDKITLSKKPELDKEFFESLYGDAGIETEADFRKRVKEDMEASLEGREEGLVRESIKEALIDGTEIDWHEATIKRYMREAMFRNVEEDKLDTYYDFLLRSLRWDLISKKIQEDGDDLSVKPEEVMEEAKKAILDNFTRFMPGQEFTDEQVNDFALRMLEAEDRKHEKELYERLFFEKITDFVKEKITIVEEEISETKFEEIEKEFSEKSRKAYWGKLMEMEEAAAKEKEEAAAAAAESENV